MYDNFEKNLYKNGKKTMNQKQKKILQKSKIIFIYIACINKIVAVVKYLVTLTFFENKHGSICVTILHNEAYCAFCLTFHCRLCNILKFCWLGMTRR